MKHMKKWTALMCVLASSAVFAFGCEKDEQPEETETPVVSVEAGEHLLTVKNDGTVTDRMVEQFDEATYSKDDLKADIETELAEVNQSEQLVTLQDISLANGKVAVTLQYASTQAYEDYNETYVTSDDVILFQGTVKQAKKAGYKLKGTYAKAGSDETVEAATLQEDEDIRVVVTNEACKVMLEQDILYVSDGVTIDTGAAVTVADTVNYIFYKEAQAKEDE